MDARMAAALRRFDDRFGWSWLGACLSVAIIAAAAVVLFRNLRGTDVGKVMDAVRATEPRDVAVAAGFVAAAYFTLTFYDLFALRTIGRRDVPYRVAALAGFTSYAIGHNVGASVFTGGAVRYRVYSAHGLSAIEVAKICFLAGLTFWLGNAAVLGLGISYAPAAATAIDQLPPSVNRVLALATLVILLVYVAWVWRTPRVIGRHDWEVPLPNGPFTLVQIAIGIVDLGCCTAAMYMLLPEEPYIGFVALAVIFVAATLLGFASHSPGGLGVFDAAMLVALWQYDKEDLLAGLLLFRVLYYITPFALALAILGGRELWLRLTVAVARRADKRACRADKGRRPHDSTEVKLGARPSNRVPLLAGSWQFEHDLIGEPVASSSQHALQYRAMAPEDQRRTHDRTVSWLGRLKRARFVLIAGALVFLALDLMGALSALQAAIAFVIIGVVALIDAHAGEAPGVPALSPEGKPLPPDWLVEAVVSGLPDAVIALDRRGMVIASNASAREVAPNLTRGTPLSFALRVPEITEAVRRAVATGETQHVEFREKVPAERWSEAIVAPVALAAAVAGRRELFFVTLHDITRIKQVEEMRADFVANASHELRTPLASLSGFIETLQGPARNDPQARERFLDIMKAQANRMARLIDDLLSLSRIELKAHVQPEHQVDLAPIVRQVTDGLQDACARPRCRGQDRDAAGTRARARRPRRADPRVREPDRERAQIRRRRQAGGHRACARGRRQRGDGCGARLRARHCTRAPAAADRKVLPRRCDREPGTGRHRPRACAGQAYPAPPPRAADHRQRARQGRDVHGAAAARSAQIAPSAAVLRP